MVEYWQWYHMTRYAVLTCTQKLTRVSFTAQNQKLKTGKRKTKKIKTTVLDNSLFNNLLSVLWHCWLGARKSIQPVKIEWSCVGVVICLEWGADCLHMVQLMPLHPKTPSSPASFESRLVLPFCYRLTQVVLENRPLHKCSSSSIIA